MTAHSGQSTSRRPAGSILNCLEPAAVASRHLIGHFLPGAIFSALADAAPGRLMAGGSEPVWITLWRGQHGLQSKTPGASFLLSHFQLGGAGARPTKDGLSTTGFPSGVGGVPVEVIESLAPLLQQHRELRQDSGGAGKFRGGPRTVDRDALPRGDAVGAFGND